MDDPRRVDRIRDRAAGNGPRDHSRRDVDDGQPRVPLRAFPVLVLSPPLASSVVRPLVSRPLSIQVTYILFHYVTGVPFDMTNNSGVFDNLTLWEQIDSGAQYTPAKKWLTTLPIVL